jgi:hypothetical protein
MIVVKTPSIYHEDAKVPLCEMDATIQTRNHPLPKPEATRKPAFSQQKQKNQRQVVTSKPMHHHSY